MIESDEKLIIGGVGAIALAALVISLLQKEEKEPPEEIAAQINSVSWETVDYDFTDDWGDPKTAKFYKAEISITSGQAFTGSIILSSPNVISPVSLLTEDAYQQMLQEIDDLIASTTGATQQLWMNRKEIALQFPSVDGFRIDYRWWSDWDQRFRTLIESSVDQIKWQNISVPEGDSTVYVGFFGKYGAAIGLFPMIISLYSDDTMLAAVESNILPPENVPQLLGFSIPESVPSGGEVPVSVTLRLPPVTNHDYSFSLTVGSGLYRSRVARASYAPTSMVNTWISRGCSPFHLPLDAPDNIYTIEGIYDGRTGEWELGKAEYRSYTDDYLPLPPGVYPVYLEGESWKIAVPSTGCGVNYYGYDAAERYDFGIIGYLEVV